MGEPLSGYAKHQFKIFNGCIHQVVIEPFLKLFLWICMREDKCLIDYAYFNQWAMQNIFVWATVLDIELQPTKLLTQV